MILQSLCEYYEALTKKNLAPHFGFGYEKADLGINIDEDGRLNGVIPLVNEVEINGKKVEFSREFELPQRVVRSANVLPNFLSDNGGYLLGIDKKDNPTRTKKMFNSFLELHQEILEGVKSDFARRILLFLENWEIETARENEYLKDYIEVIEAGRNIVFMKEGRYFAQDDEEIRAAWLEYYNNNLGKQGLCLVTGKVEPIARLHGKIRGFPGAQSAGANLISINSDAFTSYNLDDDIPSAPVGEYASFAYATALNILLSKRETRIKLGDTIVLLWAEEGDEKAVEIVSSTFNPPRESDGNILESIFKNIEKGLPVDDIKLDSKFYVLGLAPNAARISVAFFFENTFFNILNNIRLHHERLEIIKPSFDQRTYLSPYDIFIELVNSKSKEKKTNPQIINGLFRGIFMNQNYPFALYQTVIARVRAEQKNLKVNRGKVAIIKACLLQRLKKEEEREVLTVALNKESKNKPYLLGRLFSVLEQAQEDAIPGIKTTIRDSSFSTATANPEIVFPQLLKLSNHHISKIIKDQDKNKQGRGYWYERKKQEILGGLEVEENPFPANLSLQDQGLFILGYYHENQDRYTKKEDK